MTDNDLPVVDLAQIVDDFADAERALRQLTERAEALSSAESRLHAAEATNAEQVAEVRSIAEAEIARAGELVAEALRGHQAVNDEVRTYAASRLDDALEAIKAAQTALRTAEKATADGAAAVFRLASDVTDSARDLRDVTARLRDVDPQTISQQLSMVVRRLGLLTGVAVAVLVCVIACLIVLLAS